MLPPSIAAAASLPRLLLLACLGLATAACAGGNAADSARPQVGLEAITLVDTGLVNEDVAMKLQIANPGVRTLRFTGISANFRLDDRFIAQGVSRGEQALPPGASMEVVVRGPVNADVILSRVLGGLKDKRPTFRITGSVFTSQLIAEGLPYSVEGRLVEVQGGRETGRSLTYSPIF